MQVRIEKSLQDEYSLASITAVETRSFKSKKKLDESVPRSKSTGTAGHGVHEKGMIALWTVRVSCRPWVRSKVVFHPFRAADPTMVRAFIFIFIFVFYDLVKVRATQHNTAWLVDFQDAEFRTESRIGPRRKRSFVDRRQRSFYKYLTAGSAAERPPPPLTSLPRHPFPVARIVKKWKKKCRARRRGRRRDSELMCGR